MFINRKGNVIQSTIGFMGSLLPTVDQLKDYCGCSGIEARKILRRRKVERNSKSRVKYSTMY